MQKLKRERIKKSDVFVCHHCKHALDIVHVTEYKPFAEGLQVICRNCTLFKPKWITPKNRIPDD